MGGWQLVDWMLRTIGLVIVLVTINATGGKVEGFLFPVVEDFEIETYERAGDVGTRISGHFTIVRPGCDFAGLEWVLKGVSRDVVANVQFEEGTRIREGGRNDFGPWRIQLTERQIRSQSHAVAFHKCPYRWWITKTDLHP